MSDVVANVLDNFKQRFSPKIIEAVPDNAILSNDVKYEAMGALGKTFLVPTIVGSEQGATYKGPNAGGFNLSDATGTVVKQASVDGYQFIMSGILTQEDIERGNNGDMASWEKTTDLVVKDLKNSTNHRLESAMLYGGTDLGVVKTSANVNATSTWVVFDTGEWAGGNWAGRNGSLISFYNAAGTLVNGSTGIFTLVVSDNKLKRIKVSGIAADITALDAAILSSSGHYVDWAGAHGASMLGMDYQFTTSGTMFGLDNTLYDVRKGQEYAVGGAIDLEAILQATETAFSYGLMDKTVNCYINQRAWTVLAKDEAGLRMFDKSYEFRKGENGFRELAFFTHSGEIVIKAHSMVKESEGFIFSPDDSKLVGATPFKFMENEGKLINRIPRTNKYEINTYWHLQIYFDYLAQCTKLSGITY